MYNKLGKSDPAIWEASEVPAKTPYLSARGWEQYRFALDYNRRHHPKSPFDEGEADRIDQDTLRLLHAHCCTQQDQHECPVLNSPLTDSEILRHLKATSPDKSQWSDGISHRMLQAGGQHFQKSLCLLLMNMIWEFEIYPYDWSKALVQPIHKGDAKPRVDPASYRGIYLTCMTTKLFEDILNERLTDFTTQHDTLTPYQFSSKKGHQTQDAIYAVLATIRNNQQFDKSPTYCAFIDFSTAYPSVHRNRLTNIHNDSKIPGKVWRLLTSTYHLLQVRVLHPLLGPDRFTPILRGLLEGSRLSPTPFGIFMAELLRTLQKEFPHACTYTSQVIS